jgi:SecD/SecF fusion protein
MQLKGLVRFFTFALILICLYQLSFTWFVRSHEKSMEAKAAAWVKKLPTAQSVYPNDKEQQFLYNDSVSDIQKAYYKRLLDSTKDTKLAFGLTTYASAKEKELMLGLDLQGGMSVTMEVGLDGLIKSLANYTKDASFNTALNNAVAKKANSSADLISLFRDEYKTVNPSGKLAPLFATRSNGKLKFDASDDATATYLKEQATQAFDNTYRILRTRIDRFGLASPNINPDPNKGIISIELAGVNDKERVRSYLQSTANLQFFEVYTFENKDFQAGILAADKAIEASLNGISDTSAKADTTLALANKNPLLRTVQFTQPFQGKNGQFTFPAEIGYTLKKDTATLNAYLALPEVRSKFPANLIFMYGKVESEDPKTKDVLPLYAIKTLDNGIAELEGDHVANAAQDFDERGKVAIKMNMDKIGTSIWGKMTTRNIGKPIAIVLDNIL